MEKNKEKFCDTKVFRWTLLKENRWNFMSQREASFVELV